MEDKKLTLQGKELVVLDKKPSNDGSYIILVHGWNDITPYVVWRYWPDRNAFYSGDYCCTIQGALLAFDDRN